MVACRTATHPLHIAKSHLRTTDCLPFFIEQESHLLSHWIHIVGSKEPFTSIRSLLKACLVVIARPFADFSVPWETIQNICFKHKKES
jgi:hypothetical protein